MGNVLIMTARQFFSHRKLGLGVFLSLGLSAVVIGQMVPLGFWSGMTSLGSFSISGVRGSTDTTTDAWLVNDTNPTIVFGASTGATSYDVVIKNAADSVVICQTLGAATTSVAVAACSLANNTSYRAHVTAKVGGATRAASNNSFSFTVDNTTPTVNTITGITGASDVTADGWLVSGLVPTVNWNAFTNASSYDVIVRDSAGVAVVCALQNSATTSHNFSACTLTDGATYKAYVTAKSPSGFNVINASNTGFNFTVDNTAPGAFSITGITGGTDAVIDAFLTNGSDPTVNYGNSTNVYRYDVTIKDSTGTTTICSNLNQTGSPTAVAACALTNGVSYKAYATAKSISTFITTNASNTGFSFTVGAASTPPGNFLISGATGGTDAVFNSWLTSGTNVTANWYAASGATSYDVVIRNSDDTADVCPTQNTTATSYAFATCTLTVGSIYQIKVTAKNPATTAAFNNGYLFQVRAQDPASFTISGVSGGADVTADAYLTSGTTVTGTWSGSATSFDVTVRNSADTSDVCATQNTTSNSLTFAACPLTAGADYKLKVVAITGTRTTVATNSPFSFYVPASLNFCPTGSSTAKALVIYDSGGAAGNYGNSESCNFTISPPSAPPQIVMNFTAFSTSANSDVLTAYNGTTTGGPLLGSFKNTSTPPADITATSGNMYLTWATGASGVTTGYAMNYRAIYASASSFITTGVKGGTDVTADLSLTDNSAGVTVDWAASTNAVSYSVSIFDSFSVMRVCGPVTTTSLSLNLPGCSLMLGSAYAVTVTALDANGGTQQSFSTPMVFQYENRPSYFSINGITGGTDVTADSSLENGTAATLNWTASTNHTSYDVTIYENDGSTVKCLTTNVAAGLTSYAFAGCSLVAGSTYKASVIAKNANGSTLASNDNLSFFVGLVWSPTSLTLAPIPRYQHTATWTGSEMIVWGGYDDGQYYNTGAKYNATTDSWTPTASGVNCPSIRANHSAIWTGSNLIIWGGGKQNSFHNDGGRYNPSTDTWAAAPLLQVPQARNYFSSIWTGSEMIVWGGAVGSASSDMVNTGSRYNPTTDSWSAVSTGTNVPSPRSQHSAIWTNGGGQMVVWGGHTGSGLLNTGGRYTLATDSWTATSVGANLPLPRDAHSAIWTGSQMVVWGGIVSSGPANTGGRYDPSTDAWTATSVGANVPTSRSLQSAIWTGTEMIIWGGFVSLGSVYYNTGGKYNPSTDVWVATSTGANVPTIRASHTAIWTGTEMIVWGGYAPNSAMNTGGKYNPTSNAWATTSIGANVPSARERHSAVWTGTQMIIWGGIDIASFNTGGKYTPGTDTWTTTSVGANVPASRAGHSAVWTGSKMLVWGGDAISTKYGDGGNYDPAADTWLPIIQGLNVPTPRKLSTTIWTGTEMIIWGGSTANNSGNQTNTGARYNPTSDSWTPTSVGANVASLRDDHVAVWTGTEMIVWGGLYFTATMNTGGRYNPSTNSWTATSTGANNPSARLYHKAVWTGSEMIVWGGSSSAGYDSTGARYNPSTDSWTPTSLGANVPVGRLYFTSVWDGTSMIVWGGRNPNLSEHYNTGAKYNPTTDSWTATGMGASTPTVRCEHSAVWTGTRMIIWGGQDSGVKFDSGGVLLY